MKPQTYEGYMIENGLTGQYFYTDKSPEHMHVIAIQKKRKILTERAILVTSTRSNPQAQTHTKVILQ
jgi:hypothetical protein